ncbi:MAG: hypothetical protein GXO62_03390 [Epsilonproteobacteria bacterium]|nr:hypothetical protein [Campylobacterota bacterium]
MQRVCRCSEELSCFSVLEKKDTIKAAPDSKKGSVIATLYPNSLIIKKIELSPKIKENLLYDIIKAKLSKEIKEDFEFYYSFEEEIENAKIYKVQILLKKEINACLKRLNTKEISKITTDYHSLFAISKKYFEEITVAIYISEKNILYVAGKDELQYFRSSPLTPDIEQVASEINRTIIYFSHQLKTEIKKVLIAGESEPIQNLIPHIQTKTFQPLSIVQNLPGKAFNRHFVTFGALFAKESFLPEEIKEYKTFKSVFYLTAAVLVVANIFLAFRLYSDYSTLKNNEILLANKQRLFQRLKKNTTMLDEKRLDYYINYFTLLKKSDESMFFDELNSLFPIYEYLTPTSIQAGNEIVVRFQKRFKRFKNLINTKEQLEQILKKLNLHYTLNCDYSQNLLNLTLKLKRKK